MKAVFIWSIAAVAAVICAGCSERPDLDWEFMAVLPHSATLAERIAMEDMLRSNGYKRITFREYNVSQRAICIRATKTESDIKEQGAK